MFRFLALPRPAADPRHQALGAAIGWSYELLTEPERRGFRALSEFAGGFGLAEAAAVCCGGDQAAALDLVDVLAGKSLLVAEPAAGGTRYRLLETIRQYAAGRLAQAGEAEQAKGRHAGAFLALAERERQLGVLLPAHDNFRAALDHVLAAGGEAGPRLARALGGFWLARGFFQEGRGWLERALAAGPADRRLRADLLRLLGAVLYAAGDIERARATLAQALEAAEAAGAPAAQARIRVLQAEIYAIQSGEYAGASEECQTAIPLLESEGDLEGMADAWLLAGKLQYWACDDPAGAEQALERAADCARQSANYRVEVESREWLAAIYYELDPIDVAISRGERLLEAASGDPWAEAAVLHVLSAQYGCAGRLADARAAYRRSQSIFAGSGARFDWARRSIESGWAELIAGDPAVAEQNVREGYDVLCAMGERGWRVTAATILAEAAYAQGQLGQALRLTEEAEALAGPGDLDAQARWRATRAKVLARRGQYPAAARLAQEAVALIPPTRGPLWLAELLMARAEVSQLAGALDQAEADLRRALQIYQDRRIVPLAGRTRTLLASLTEQRAAR